MFNLIPPFKVGEKRPFPYKDNWGGASPLEWFGLLSLAYGVGCILNLVL